MDKCFGTRLRVTTILFFLSLLFWPNILFAGNPADDNFGLNPSATTAFSVGDVKDVPLKDVGTTDGIATMIGKIVGVVLGFLGALFFGLIVYAGLKWMTARGNDTQIKDAQKIMQNAIIGLAIVLGSYAITRIMGEILK